MIYLDLLKFSKKGAMWRSILYSASYGIFGHISASTMDFRYFVYYFNITLS